MRRFDRSNHQFYWYPFSQANAVSPLSALVQLKHDNRHTYSISIYTMHETHESVRVHLKLRASCYICMLMLPCFHVLSYFLSLMETCFCIIYCHFGRYDCNIYLSSCGALYLGLFAKNPFYSNKKWSCGGGLGSIPIVFMMLIVIALPLRILYLFFINLNSSG